MSTPRASSELEKEKASEASLGTVTMEEEIVRGPQVVGADVGEKIGDAPPTATATESAHDEEVPALTKRNKVIIVGALCVRFSLPSGQNSC